MTDEQLSALLRLKRFEQPPPGYFDGLLRDVHRRQRADLLRQPLWRIALERVQVFFSEHSLGTASFAGSMAAVLAVGLVAIHSLTPSERPVSTNLAAASAPGVQASSPSPTASLAANAIAPRTAPNRYVVLQHPGNAPLAEPEHVYAAPPSTTLASQPRYIIDARPVSYEPSPSFSF